MEMKIISILLLIRIAESARILGIFPTPSISHQVVFHALVKDLASNGHHMTILTTDLIKIENSNVTQIKLHGSREIYGNFDYFKFKENKMTEIDLLQSLSNRRIEYVDKQLSHPRVKSLITNSGKVKFDVMIFEHKMHLAYLAFAELYDCPAIGIVSTEMFNQVHEWFGNEANPVLHPEYYFPYDNENLTFGERWNSLVYYLTVKFFVEPSQKAKAKRLVEKHFPTVKSSVEELQERLQFLMTNANSAIGFIRPILPNTIQLGFMHIEPPKQLLEGELKNFLDKSKNGVIYMSLGSNIQSKDMNPQLLRVILRTFGSIRYDVLWKFEIEIPNLPNNVMISKWLPQADLLAHPNIKLFITQGGQQSVEEAIDRMVPMIVIPFMSDQNSYARKMQNRGVGRHLEFDSLTESKLIDAINEMVKPKYKENIRKLRKLVNDQPMTSRERAVWWTEYVIRHKGAKHLEYHGRSVPFYQRFWLDFIAISVGISFVVVRIVSLFIRNFLCQIKVKCE